jgi:hypothetical protein
MAAIAGRHRLVGRLLLQVALALGGHHGLDRACQEEHPAVVAAAQRAVHGGSKPPFGEDVGQIGEDGCQFGDHGIAMRQCGHLAHGIEGQVVGGLHRGAVFQPHGLVAGTAFLQHPARDDGARTGVVEKAQRLDRVGHEGSQWFEGMAKRPWERL